MAAHRYWRIRCIANPDYVYFGLSECELRTSVGGADVTGSGTASASEVQGGYPVASAFDNNTGSNWYTNTSTSIHWLKYDFGAGQEKDIVEVSIRAAGLTNATPTFFQIQYSDNDVDWVTKWTVSNIPAFTANETKVFTYAAPSGLPHRYFRLYITAHNSTSYDRVTELQLRGASGAQDLTKNGTPSASSFFAGFPASYAFLPSGNEWASALPNDDPQWLKWDFGADISVIVREITVRAGSITADSIKDFTLQASDNDFDWVTLLTVTNQTSWGASEVRTWEVPLETPPTTVPDAPTSLVANTISGVRIDIDWDAPVDDGGSPITGYKIERESPTGGGFSVIVADTGSTDTVYSNTGLSPTVEYNYRVSAINSIGTSVPSNEASAITSPQLPGQVENLSAIAISDTEIDLDWDAPTDLGTPALNGYKIEIDPGTGWTVLVADTGDTNTEYSVSGLDPGTLYSFRVTAFSVAGEGPYSTTASATTTGGGSSSGGILSVSSSPRGVGFVYAGLSGRYRR